jgi:hypothetical protein
MRSRRVGTGYLQQKDGNASPARKILANTRGNWINIRLGLSFLPNNMGVKISTQVLEQVFKISYRQ